MKYTDYYDLLERYSIMTEDGGTNPADALESLRNETTPELLQRLKNEIFSAPAGSLNEYLNNKIGLYPCNENARPLCKIYDENRNVIDGNRIKDAETLQSWKQKNIV